MLLKSFKSFKFIIFCNQFHINAKLNLSITIVQSGFSKSNSSNNQPHNIKTEQYGSYLYTTQKFHQHLENRLISQL